MWHIDLQSQAIYVDKKETKKKSTYLKDGASGCAIDDIEQVIVKILFEL